MKTIKTTPDIFNLSFLDVITCAFGAMILILLVTRHDDDNSGKIEKAKNELNLLNIEEGSKDNLNSRLTELTQLLKTTISQNDELNKLSSEANVNLGNSLIETGVFSREKSGLELVKESLNNNSSSTQSTTERDIEVGGIPVNSDYVIFIIDTSGSMKSIWPKVIKELENVLSIHPKVNGFQVMSDNGKYLISGYADRWIPDITSLRKSAIGLLRNWSAFSNSSPVEGLEKALKVYGKKNTKTSIYIFGDDYTGASFDGVISLLERINLNSSNGNPIVKVHGIGFIHPDYSAKGLKTERKFSILMREVARTNGGAFVALPLK